MPSIAAPTTTEKAPAAHVASALAAPRTRTAFEPAQLPAMVRVDAADTDGFTSGDDSTTVGGIDASRAAEVLRTGAAAISIVLLVISFLVLFVLRAVGSRAAKREELSA